MIRGLYTAATGMLAQQSVQDAIAGNLANVNTAGFKQDVPTFKALHEMALSRFPGGLGGRGAPIGSIGTGVEFDRNVMDTSPGSLQRSENPLDLALSGDGYFSVMTSRGERYTRDGQFHMEPEGKGPDGKPTGFLSDGTGNKVLGLKGPIQATGAGKVEIDAKGNVAINGKIADRLKIVTAPAASMQKEGGNVLSMQTAPAPSKATVKSGFVEQSNVNVISEMVRMITVQRAYEAAQKAITSQDDSLNKAVNEIAR